MLKYLQHPTLINELDLSIWSKVKKTIVLYLKYLVFAITLFFLLKLMDRFIVQYFFHHSILKQLTDLRQWVQEEFGAYTILVVVIIAPLTEEIIFRLPMRLEKTGIGLSAGLLFYRLSVENFYEFKVFDPFTYLKMGLAFIIFLLIAKFFPDRWLNFLKEKYVYVFYGLAVAFALVHLGNLSPYNNEVLLFYPLYTLPQFLMGLFMGYARMHYGFFYGVLIHALINLPSVLFH